MSDRYVLRPSIGIWRCTEEGEPVELVDPLAELNHLSRLVEASVNQAHLTDRTHVQHAFLKENMDGKLVASMREEPDQSERDYHFMTIRKDHWNRMVRVLKELAERFVLP